MKGGVRMNQVGLVGRLTKDPTLRQLSENKSTVSFVIAINRNFRNNQGSVDADYLLCVAWGKLAERIAKHCGKGSLIGVLDVCNPKHIRIKIILKFIRPRLLSKMSDFSH